MADETHVDRVRRVIGLGRDGSSAARAEIERMARGEADERWLALHSCFGSRDGAHVLATASDPSRRVRGKALSLVALACDDAQAFEALTIAYGLRAQRQVLLRLTRRDRTAPVDRYLDWLHQREAIADLTDQLPYGSPAAVRRHLALALDRPSERLWKGLSRRHAPILGEILAERWRRVAGEADPVTRILTDRFLPEIARRAPDEALAVVRLLRERGIDPDGRVVGTLASCRPVEALELALDSGLRASDLRGAALAALPADTLGRVAREAPWLIDWSVVLPRAPVASRRAAAAAWAEVSERHPRYFLTFASWLDDAALEAPYRAWSRAARDQRGVISWTRLAELPPGLRAREARRHIRQVVALRPHPAQRLAGYARHLPWDEANAEIAVLLGHPDGAQRAVALVELLSLPQAQDSDAHASDALALVVARKHEQDPVRCAMISTLAAWPASLWRRERLEAVSRILRDALDASDLSQATAAAAERLVIGLFGIDVTWAAGWLETLVRERGQIHSVALGSQLDEAAIAASAGPLLAVARSWAAQERYAWVLQLASSLGEHLLLIEGLIELLAEIREQTPEPWTFLSITRLLGKHAPELHAATEAWAVERMLARAWPEWLVHLCADREIPWSAVLRDAMFAIARAAARPHDLIGALRILRTRDPAALGEIVPELLSEDPSVVVVDVVWKFLHRYRTDLLTPYLEGRPVTGRFATGGTAWVLPFTDGFFRWTREQNALFARILARVASDADRNTPTVLWAISLLPALTWAPMDGLCALADDPRPVVREKAIRVMSRCDEGQGVPTLLRCLEDERGRFAIYGLRRALLSMLPEQAAEHLAGAPTSKVTIAKEVVRLMGDVRCDRAYELLIGAADGRLHRDVRIAVLRALWDHLHREPTWRIYEEAVADPDWVLASRVGDVPPDRLTDRIDRRLSALLARVLARPEPEARLSLLQSAHRLAVRDPERRLLGAVRARLASPYDDEVQAAAGALLARQDERDIPAFGEAIRALASDPRALSVALDRLAGANLTSRDSWRRTAEAFELAVADDPRWTALRLRAAASYRPASSLAALIETLGVSDRLDFDALDAVRTVLRAARPADDPWTSTELAALAGATAPTVRRAAIWLLEQRVAAAGWTPELLETLAALRADPSPLVAGAAQRVFPPREDEPSPAARGSARE